MLASGKNKGKAVRELLGNDVMTTNPSTLLLTHPNVTVLIDCGSVNL